jgi:hypothetical protein
MRLGAEAILQRMVRRTYGLQAVAFVIAAVAAYYTVQCSLSRCHGLAMLGAISLAIGYHTFNLAIDIRDFARKGLIKTIFVPFELNAHELEPMRA